MYSNYILIFYKKNLDTFDSIMIMRNVYLKDLKIIYYINNK
jgi:hypothetical protein